MNARRRGGEKVIDEEDEEYREDDRALGYASTDRVQCANLVAFACKLSGIIKSSTFL